MSLYLLSKAHTPASTAPAEPEPTTHGTLILHRRRRRRLLRAEDTLLTSFFIPALLGSVNPKYGHRKKTLHLSERQNSVLSKTLTFFA